MKKSIRSLIALVLTVLMLCSLGVTAFAEHEPIYVPDQSYREGEGQTEVYTVQIAVGPNLSGAERIRNNMLAGDYDCFILEAEDGYHILCGKFTDVRNAYRYCLMIHEDPGVGDAFVTTVQLPQAAVDEFVEHYKKDPYIVNDPLFNGWEEPTGPFIDMNSNEEETRTVYAVKFSGCDDFASMEARRDQLTSLGFDGYVVKGLGCYNVIGGVFENKDDALAYRDQIREATGRVDASVCKIQLPVSIDFT